MKKGLIFLLSIALASCHAFFDKDIEERIVTVVAPVDGVSVPEGEVTFLWEPVNRADGYRLTVVSPSFAMAGLVVLDTLLVGTDSTQVATVFRQKLKEGRYQWNIRGWNPSYYTQDRILDLYVHPADNDADGEGEKDPGDGGGDGSGGAGDQGAGEDENGEGTGEDGQGTGNDDGTENGSEGEGNGNADENDESEEKEGDASAE